MKSSLPKNTKQLAFLLMLLMGILQNSEATTCAQIYNEKFHKHCWTSGPGVICMVTVLPYAILHHVMSEKDPHYENHILTAPLKRARVANLFKAATFLTTHHHGINKKREWAQNIIDHFYNKYIDGPFPESPTPKGAVIDRLAYVDKFGVELGICHGLYSKKYLARAFFPQGVLQIDEIIANRKEWLAEKERLKQRQLEKKKGPKPSV